MKSPYETTEAIRGLWVYFPHWSLGKLIDNLAIWVRGPECQDIENESNDEHLATARSLIEKREMDDIEWDGLVREQHRAIRAFESYLLAHELSQVGAAMNQCARSLHKRVYDVEDNEWQAEDVTDKNLRAHVCTLDDASPIAGAEVCLTGFLGDWAATSLSKPLKIELREPNGKTTITSATGMNTFARILLLFIRTAEPIPAGTEVWAVNQVSATDLGTEIVEMWKAEV